MNARVLIAGCGFVGAPLAARLAQRGCDVFALRRSEAVAPRGVRPVRADLARIETLGVLPEAIDVIVYMAGPSAPIEAAYRAALDIKPSECRTLNNLGVLLLEHNQLDEAVECFRRGSYLREIRYHMETIFRPGRHITCQIYDFTVF